MAKNSILADIERKLDRIKNHIAEEIAPEVNKLFKESVSWSLIDWYNDYDPKMYQRTNNLMGIINSARTYGNKNILTMIVD